MADGVILRCSNYSYFLELLSHAHIWHLRAEAESLYMVQLFHQLYMHNQLSHVETEHFTGLIREFRHVVYQTGRNGGGSEQPMFRRPQPRDQPGSYPI